MERIALDTSASQSRDQEASKELMISTNHLIERGCKKLSQAEKIQVLTWIGCCKSLPEIVKLVKEKFGKTITKRAIQFHKYHPDNKAVIQRFREEWSRDIFLVDLANKRKRLERIENICDRCEKEGDLNLALQAISQIRTEVEKDLSSLNMTNYNINVYKDMTESEIEEERIKSLERIKILKSAIKDVTNRGEITNASEK